MISNTRATAGARVEAALTGVAGDRGAVAAIATTAIAAVNPSAAVAALTHRLDLSISRAARPPATERSLEAINARRVRSPNAREGPFRHATHRGRSRPGQLVQEILEALDPDDRDQALERLGRKERVGAKHQCPERLLCGRLAALPEDLCGHHLRTGQRMPERPDQAFFV